MKISLQNNLRKLFILCFSFHVAYAQHNGKVAREVVSLNKNWKFHLGSANDPSRDFDYGIVRNFTIAGGGGGCIVPKFDDSSWSTVNVPHDWAVELPFGYHKHFDVQSHGYRPVGGFYPNNSIGWYRKHFSVDKKKEGQRFIIRFEGVYRDFKLWINNNFIGGNFSGYSESSFDITDFIEFAEDNVLVLRVDATQYEGWFYEGAGIYRNVSLESYHPVHIPEYGIYVRADLEKSKAIVETQTTVKNQEGRAIDCALVSYIIDGKGNKITKTITEKLSVKNNDISTVKQKLIIANPEVWDLETPNLYRLVSVVKRNGITTDSTQTEFGIRTFAYDSVNGFSLNGRSMKVKGMCVHQDHAGVGTAVADALVYYRIRLLKEMGANAYRCSHNPPSKSVLEACDRLGMMVLDETRVIGSGKEYLEQFEKLILRDRNHASIMLWSLGNEETGVQNTELGRRMAHTMIQRQKELDPSRLATYGGNNGIKYFGINQEVDIRGFNYHIKELDDYHKEHPQQPVIFSEVSSMVSSRGMYVKDSLRGYLPDYDLNKPRWGQTAEEWWKFTVERPWLMGGFVWTGFDYRGEPTPFTWPNVNSHFGIMDVCGFPKNTYYYYQSWWTDKDVIKIYPHWNGHKIGEMVNVWCNSNADEVELFLNGKSLGKKRMPRNSHLEWNVTYEPGKLEAIGLKNGKTIKSVVETTDKAYQIVLTPDRKIIKADGEDVSVVNVSVVDHNGLEVPDAMNLIQFSVNGTSQILGVGNGDPSSHEADKCQDGKWQRSLFNGNCQIIIQSSEKEGDFSLTASSEGLKSATSIILMRK
ncbi:beta-galactosidase GalA [uncultured Flavobacterium sp.]|uniref:beta-galactosidase GalA n=1 Tax=uncultured Flavobacterium sp. TaxID=165435 RepID=UPI0025EB0E4B|nr:beta-galactosidase GalA [uncultured Flavobacterium sp.]